MVRMASLAWFCKYSVYIRILLYNYVYILPNYFSTPHDKEKIVHDGIYLLIIVSTILVARNLLYTEMMIKAYFFSIYPQMCPANSFNGQNTFICYVYDENRIGGKKEMLVFDSSGSMQFPPSQWAQETKNIFGFSNIARRFSDDDCHFKNTRHMVKHVFWVSDDCWKQNQ